MAWRYASVDADGQEVSALVKLSGPLGPRAEMMHAAAAAAGVAVGTILIINGDEYTVREIINPGARDEIVACRLVRRQVAPLAKPSGSDPIKRGRRRGKT